MGSGKGRARRAQAAALSAAKPMRRDIAYDIQFDAEPWEKFIAKNNLGQENMHEYYLGRDGAHLFAEPEDYEKVMSEFFADLVDTGTLTLPPDFEAQDLIFHTNTGEQAGWVAGFQEMTMSVKGYPSFWCSVSCLESDQTMGRTTTMLSTLHDTLRTLFEKIDVHQNGF
jgi:hypothetical protein